MGSKARFGEEDWGFGDYESRRQQREQAKSEKRNRKNTRKRKKLEDV